MRLPSMPAGTFLCVHGPTARAHARQPLRNKLHERNRIVNHLTEVGILTETTGKSCGRILAAVDVMNIVDRI